MRPRNWIWCVHLWESVLNFVLKGRWFSPFFSQVDAWVEQCADLEESEIDQLIEVALRAVHGMPEATR